MTTVLLLATASTMLPSVTSFCGSRYHTYLPKAVCNPSQHQHLSTLYLSSASASSSDADFSTFADSLDVDDDQVAGTATSTTTTAKRPSNARRGTMMDDKPWQAKLDELLDPMTRGAQRQILLSELLNANEKIRDSVLDALTNRKVRENV
jgi:hypothetical protein